MMDLEDWPLHLMLLLALMRCVFGVFEFVVELKEGVFEILEAWWRGFFVAGGADRWHFLLPLSFRRLWIPRWNAVLIKDVRC